MERPSEFNKHQLAKVWDALKELAQGVIVEIRIETDGRRLFIRKVKKEAV